MAAYGGAEAAARLGNEIYVTLFTGEEFPPKTCCLRVKYSQTLLDIRKGIERKLGVPVASQQLFRHNTELLEEDNKQTLLEMKLHTGFSLRGYDTRVPPVYFPPVEKGPDGRLKSVPV
eukprot:jgi/Tetstr1/440133/TSEL_028490.t1